MGSRKITGREIAHQFSVVVALLGPILIIGLAVVAAVHEVRETLLSSFTVAWFGAISLTAVAVFYFTARRATSDDNANH